MRLLPLILLLLLSSSAFAQDSERARTLRTWKAGEITFQTGRGTSAVGAGVAGLSLPLMLFGLLAKADGDPAMLEASFIIGKVGVWTFAVGAPVATTGSLISSISLRRAGFEGTVVPAALSTGGVVLVGVGSAQLLREGYDSWAGVAGVGTMAVGGSVVLLSTGIQHRLDKEARKGARQELRRLSLNVVPVPSPEGGSLALVGRW